MKYIILTLFILNSLIILCLLFKNTIRYKIEENFNTQRYYELYEKIENEWDSIFPDSNRNSGGVQFFHYIYRVLKPNKEDFDIYNKLYCGVSGSLIDVDTILNNDEYNMLNDACDLVKIKHINGGYRCGYFYRCCQPCSCDIMNSKDTDVFVEDIELKLDNNYYQYSVLTIPDPCRNSITISDSEMLPDPSDNTKPWEDVSSFTCINKMTDNAVKTESGRIIFAILFNSSICNDQEYINHEFFDENLNVYCDKRNNKKENIENEGMGDIFLELAKSTL